MTTPASPPPTGNDSFRFVGIAAALALAGAAAFWVWKAPVDARGAAEESAPAPETSSSSDTPPPPPPRCTRVGTSAYRIGQNALTTDEGAAENDAPDDDEKPGAFGAEVSRAVVTASGFAVGVRLDTAGAAHAGVVSVPTDVGNGKLVDFGKIRGDFDAPIVTRKDSGWLAGLLEPNASGSTLRVARSNGDGEPTWGADVEQGRDESLAFDLADGPKGVVVAWDDVTKDGTLSRVLWAALEANGSKVRKRTSVASDKSVDAETPRVVARPGGFWLAYIARKSVDVPKDDDDAALDRNAKGDRYAAEKIDPSWLEVMPLDESGESVGPARPVTPKSGHALTFDLATADDGAAVLVWRDDDTPSGSHGGKVSLLRVTTGGAVETQPLADRDVGSGSPTLLAGWVAVSNAAGRTMLAPLAPKGTLAGDLRLEPAVGAGEPLAASGERVLVATSVGTAIDLIAVDCKP